MAIWTELLGVLGSVLRFFHDATTGLFDGYAWSVAIVLLTVVVRLLLMPLAVKQFRSMQAMQQLRPQMKKIQQRYKADRSMMRTDPDKYRAQRQKQQEELMGLYKEHNVNPASSCLPLVAQMPIFIALFSVLRSPDVIPELATAPFPIGATLQDHANEAGIIAILMLLAMGVTTFVQQKQMMGRNVAMADDQQMQQQKMMLYIMPVFLVVLGFNLPVGVLVYWVTTNLWQMGQQWFMLREVEHSTPPAKPSKKAVTSKDTTKSAVSKDTKAADKPEGRGKKGGPSGGSKKPKSRSSRAERRNTASKNGASRNGHQSGGPNKIRKQHDETGDKRR